MEGARLTHIGGPTVLIEVGGWRILTDPTFDPAGGSYRFGWGTGSRKETDPALSLEQLGTIDAVLLSHDQHDDNLDRAGRELLPRAGVVVTTSAGAKRLHRDGIAAARGLAPWQETLLEAPGKERLEVIATPCRHGPPLSGPIVGEVAGFAVRTPGDGGTLWLSGDTVLYDGVREVAGRIEVDVALLHLGGVRFPISGPCRYTMTAADAVELVGELKPRVAVPIHYEGWKHFREGRDGVEAALAAAPAGVRERFHWLEIGVPADV